MKDIASFFITLFQDLRKPVRWIAIFCLVILIIFGVIGYERLTGHFYLTRLERKVVLLKELKSISNQEIEKDPELATIYKHISSELFSYDIYTRTPIITPISSFDNEAVGKAISSASFWILILFFGIVTEIRKAGKVTGMIIGLGLFLLFCAALFAWIGTIIPTIIHPWINFIIVPLAQIILLVLLTRKKGNKEQKHVAQSRT